MKVRGKRPGLFRCASALLGCLLILGGVVAGLAILPGEARGFVAAVVSVISGIAATHSWLASHYGAVPREGPESIPEKY